LPHSLDALVEITVDQSVREQLHWIGAARERSFQGPNEDALFAKTLDDDDAAFRDLFPQ